MAGRKVFEDSVVPLPEEDGPIQRGMLVQAAAASDKKDTMDVLFALGLDAKAKADLEDKVAAGEVVSPEELAAVTVPEKSRKKLTDWLASHGFEVDHVSDDGSSVYAKSSVANIAKQLQVDVAKVTRDGVTYNAARTAPSLPQDVGAGVQAIIGLQPFRHANKHSAGSPRGPSAIRSWSGPPSPPRASRPTWWRTSSRRTAPRTSRRRAGRPSRSSSTRCRTRRTSPRSGSATACRPAPRG